MLTLTSPIETWAHRLPAWVKMLALALWTALLFRLGPLPLAFATLAILTLPLTVSLAFTGQTLRLLRPLLPFLILVALWHLWLLDARGGTLVLLRLIATVAAANLLTLTTRLTDLMAVLTTLARPLRPLGLNPATLALAVALVIRFLPVMLHKLTLIQDSHRARSARHAPWRILIPALLAALDDAEHVAEALRARGGAG